MAGFLTISCDWGDRHEEILCCRDAGWLHQRVHSDGQEVRTHGPSGTFTHYFQDDANDDPWERVRLSL